jgi:hypothetical protein
MRTSVLLATARGKESTRSARPLLADGVTKRPKPSVLGTGGGKMTTKSFWAAIASVLATALVLVPSSLSATDS